MDSNVLMDSNFITFNKKKLFAGSSLAVIVLLFKLVVFLGCRWEKCEAGPCFTSSGFRRLPYEGGKIPCFPFFIFRLYRLSAKSQNPDKTLMLWP